jgi:hypothetical protein
VSRNRTALTIRSLCLVTALAALCAPGAEAQINLRQVLEPYFATYGLPALAAAVVKDGTVVAAGAVGTRKVGTKIPVTTGDRFHLGSDTKAITALLAAILALSSVWPSEEVRRALPNGMGVVPKVGVEPTHPSGYTILSRARLPVPPLRRDH